MTDRWLCPIGSSVSTTGEVWQVVKDHIIPGTIERASWAPESGGSDIRPHCEVRLVSCHTHLAVRICASDRASPFASAGGYIDYGGANGYLAGRSDNTGRETSLNLLAPF